MILTLHLKDPLVKLRTLLSELPSVQALSGVADATAALDFIHYGYVEKVGGQFPAQAKKPFPQFIVSLEDFTRTRSTTSGFDQTIFHTLFMEVETPATVRELSYGDRYMWWLGECQTVIDELSALVAPQDRLLINDIASQIIPQVRPLDDSQDQGETWVAAFLLEMFT